MCCKLHLFKSHELILSGQPRDWMIITQCKAHDWQSRSQTTFSFMWGEEKGTGGSICVQPDSQIMGVIDRCWQLQRAFQLSASDVCWVSSNFLITEYNFLHKAFITGFTCLKTQISLFAVTKMNSVKNHFMFYIKKTCACMNKLVMKKTR